MELKEIKKICDDIVAQINFLAEANFILDKWENNFVYYDRYDGFFLMDNFISIDVSGNYEIKINENKKELKKIAIDEDTSLSGLIIKMIEEGMKNRNKTNVISDED